MDPLSESGLPRSDYMLSYLSAFDKGITQNADFVRSKQLLFIVC